MAEELTKGCTVQDLVELFNAEKIRYKDIIDLFGVSRDVIQKRLAGIGLRHDNKKKKFVGEATEENLNTRLSELLARKRKSRIIKQGDQMPKVSNASKKIVKSELLTSKNESAVAIEDAKKNESAATSKIVSDNESASKSNSELDSIDMLLLQNEDASVKQVYRGFYWDKDIIDFLDSHVKHGKKSALLNEIVRTVLKSKGLIK